MKNAADSLRRVEVFGEMLRCLLDSLVFACFEAFLCNECGVRFGMGIQMLFMICFGDELRSF